MARIEHGEFVYNGQIVRIGQEDEGKGFTTFIISSGEETISMDGPWDPVTKVFTRNRNYSDQMRYINGRHVKQQGHIPYLGAEGLGKMLEMGIIDEYCSSDQGNRSPGTNKGLVYLQKGHWEGKFSVSPMEEDRTRIRIRRRS